MEQISTKLVIVSSVFGHPGVSEVVSKPLGNFQIYFGSGDPKYYDKRTLIFENHPLLSAWLSYHARHSDVFFDGRMISDMPVPANLAF